jgi:hypothetical protein
MPRFEQVSRGTDPLPAQFRQSDAVVLDPTECTAIWIKNDTTVSVIAKHCNVTCDSFRQVHEMAPDDKFLAKAQSGSKDDYWLFSQGPDTVIGCINLRLDYLDDDSVSVSESSPCP